MTPLSGTSAPSPEPRRWTLRRGTNSWSQTGPLIERGESVEVMPVEEHEQEMAANALVAYGNEVQLRLAALREAAQAVAEALNFYDSTLTFAYRAEQLPLVLAAARDLRAALDATTTTKDGE